MPNHVETKLIITGDKKQLKEFAKKHFTVIEENGIKRDHFDFDTIIPMPKSLDITNGSLTSNAMALLQAEQGDFTEIDIVSEYSWIKEKKPANSVLSNRDYTIKELKKNLDEKAMEEGKIALENIEKYGSATWYDWKIANWGTRWGAYNVHISQCADIIEVSYNTAWSPATPIFEKLSEMYPNLTFEQYVLDEGMGFGGKQYWDKDGYIEEMHEDDGLYMFCNDHFGYNFSLCKKCKEWFNPEWLDAEQDENICEECQPELV